MKTITKPAVMARLSTFCRSHSEYGHINVSFNVVRFADGRTTPDFSHYDIPKSLAGIDDLMIKSQLDSSSIRENDNTRIYAYNLALDSENPELNTKYKTAFATGQKIQRRLNKLCDEEGYAKDFEQYLAYMFRVMNVKYITFESFAEKQYNNRWKCFKVGDIPQLVEEAISICSQTQRWGLRTVAA